MDKQWNEVDRRQHPRFPVTLRCWCSTPNVTMFITMTDISEGGFHLKTAIPLGLGQRAILSWKIDGEKEIEAEVEVVWSYGANEYVDANRRHPGMGVRILNVRRGVEHFRELLSSKTAVT